MTERNVDHDFASDPRLARLLDDVERMRALLLVVEVPAVWSRLKLCAALDDLIGRWGRRSEDLCAFIDLSNHPALPAQTVIGSEVANWDDLAEGLPQAMGAANILFVAGIEQLLADTPSRFAAFLQARARHQVVVVVTPQAERVCHLPVRGTPVYLDRSATAEVEPVVAARAMSRLAIAAARRATRRLEWLPHARHGGEGEA
jgi:hypothetical protein